MRLIVPILVVVLCGSSHASDVRHERSAVAVTIDRGLAFLAKDALAWKSEHNCVSCHHAGLVVWSMREAKERGHAVDEPVLADLTKWVAESGDGKFVSARPASAPKALNPKAVWFALALGSDPKPDALSLAGMKRLLNTVRSDQTENGSWSAWPETRPPIFGNSDEMMTALATLALMPAAATGDEPAKTARDKGIRWLAETKSDDDPQSIALRLVLLRRMVRPADEWQPLVRRIKERQNADGGWSQTAEMASDAWATGQALYSLAHAKIKPEDAVIARARAFLVKTQCKDGSWPMTSRPVKRGGSGSKSLIPITGAGSAWAVLGLVRSVGWAQEAARPGWTYSEEQLRPFWQGETMEGESVVFIKAGKKGEARASVLFPIQELLSVQSSTGDVRYEEGRDYLWKAGSREIVVPPGSRIVTSALDALRRPAKSQRYQLTHRDGNGEIYFGGRLEYHELQTIVSYSHAPGLWTSPIPKFDPKALPLSVHKLQSRESLKIVVLGDSISTGCNASGWAGGKPFQPAYPELLSQVLHERYKGQVEVVNLSVGGMDSAWGLTMVDKVVDAKPDLVLLAFGMNDSSGRPAKDFQDKIAATIKAIREKRPSAEFILIATMVGNPNWVALKQELFAEYRDALAKLCGPGVALADVTSIWSEFLRLKQDWDQTGNGVNHPNDFGHRVYAQVISTLLISSSEPATGK